MLEKVENYFQTLWYMILASVPLRRSGNCSLAGANSKQNSRDILTEVDNRLQLPKNVLRRICPS